MTGTGQALLETRKLSVDFGGLHALDALDLQVHEGEIVSVIGPNGAGKTTLFNAITATVETSSGDTLFEGESLLGLDPNRVTARGIARTFQNVRLFANMTVIENVMVSQHCRTRQHAFGALFYTRAFRREEAEIRERAEKILSFFGTRLVGYRFDQPAFTLSYANRRRLEIARAMATQPKLILLDEPVAGMNPVESAELTGLIGRLRDEWGFAIVIIEHDMEVVREVSDRVVVLDHGTKIAEGDYAEVSKRSACDRGVLGPRGGGFMSADPAADPAGGAVPLLEMRSVNAHYGAVHALRDVNLSIYAGEMVCLLGGNASGKSTTLKTLLGMLKPTSGEVVLDGEVVNDKPISYRVARGVTMVPENRRLFKRLSVKENLELGAYLRSDTAGIAADMEHVFELFPRVKERLNQKSGDAVRRRAADGRHRPGADGQTPSAAHGRALDGPGSRAGAAELRTHPADPRSRAHRVHGGAERQHGPVHRGQGLGAADGPGGARRHRREPAGPPRPESVLPRPSRH